MRYVIHVLILIGSLIATGITVTAALNGEASWYGAIISGIVFGFAAANLTLLEIRNWVRVTGHRQHSRLLRLLAAPVAHLDNLHDPPLTVEESTLHKNELEHEHASDQDQGSPGQQPLRLPSDQNFDK